jgi:hypothetical protein
MKNQNSRAYNFLKRGCGDRTADATLVTALDGLSVDGSTKLNDILDLVRECEIRSRAVGTASIGSATSVLN